MEGRLFRQLVGSPRTPGAFPDAFALSRYVAQGSRRGAPIVLSLGESWDSTPPGLTRRLGEVPAAAHGYQLSPQGLPALRVLLEQRISQEHGLDGLGLGGRDYEVAVATAGTRSTMFDFGRCLVDLDSERFSGDRRRPVVLAAGPSWDYEGVFEPSGFRLEYVELDPRRGFRPSAQDFLSAMAAISADPGERLALVVVNAQHNPTAINWDEAVVTAVIRRATELGAAVLLDDPYFAVHAPGQSPTSALAVLMRELSALGRGSRVPWLWVKSLGKQFRCNGWGLGAFAAPPQIVDALVGRYAFHHRLTYGGPQQFAMAQWLADPASAEFLEEQRRAYARKRSRVADWIRARLGHPEAELHLGECTPYLMLAIPPAYLPLPDGAERFRAHCFAATGVLLANPWMGAPGARHSSAFVRMYLGPPEKVLEEAIGRMAQAGLGYQATPATGVDADALFTATGEG